MSEEERYNVELEMKDLTMFSYVLHNFKEVNYSSDKTKSLTKEEILELSKANKEFMEVLDNVFKSEEYEAFEKRFEDINIGMNTLNSKWKEIK